MNKHIKSYISGIFLFIVVLLPQKIVGAAYDWIDKDPQKNDVFAKPEKSMEAVGGSAFVAARNMALVILAISVLIVGVSIAIGKGRKRDEAKEHMLHFFIGAVLVFSILIIIGIAIHIGSSIAN